MRPRVIWLDDDINTPKLQGTVGLFSRVFDIIRCETIDDFREKSINFEWDAAILDVLNAEANPKDIIASIRLLDKDKLWFVFSGQDSITKEDNFVKDLLSMKEYKRPYASEIIYVKSKHDKLLIDDIASAVKNQRKWQVENQYESILNIAKNRLLDADCRKYLLEILCAAAGVIDIDSHLYYNKIRVILEWMFRAARKQGLLHDKCFDQQDKINLTEASLFMAGKDTKYCGVRCKEAIFPNIISENVKNILFITGGASHTTEVEDKDIPNLTAYWKEIDTPYLLYSLTFMLCDILIWFDSFCYTHPNIEENKALWEAIPLINQAKNTDSSYDLIEEYTEKTGIVELDENGNYHVEKCILPFKNHPPLNYKIKLNKVVKNERKYQEIYPIFAVTFDILV